MVAARNQPVEGRVRFDMDRYVLTFGLPDEVGKLTIGPLHEQALERPGACP
jgi:hypothetical protein